MHNEAGRRFERLLTNDVPVGVRDRAWFYLAKIWYERGYYDRSEAALDHIGASMGAELDAERNHLLVNALMRQQRYDDAIVQLKADVYKRQSSVRSIRYSAVRMRSSRTSCSAGMSARPTSSIATAMRAQP